MIVGRREEGEEMVHAATHVVGIDMHVAEDNGEEEMLADMGKRPEWREEPEYGQTTAGPPMAEEEEKEHFMIVGCDPDGDEPTAADEEWRYFKFVDDDVQPMEVESVQLVQVQKRERARSTPEFDTENVPDDEAGLVDDNVVPCTTHDKENPVIKEGDTFIDKANFLETLRTYAIRNEFETKLEHSDRDRYRARCKDPDCEWKVFAKKLHGGNTFMVVKLSDIDVHTCFSSATIKGREATINWLSHKSKDIVKEDPTLSAKKLQKRLEKHYNIDLSYWKVWSAKKSAMNDLHGTWEESFTMLWRFKAAVEESFPGSIIEIDCKKIKRKMHFSRMFVCIRACVDGFLAGCRPYLSVDSTHLTGKYKGQLAAATGWSNCN
jgi:hypothetical protein